MNIIFALLILASSVCSQTTVMFVNQGIPLELQTKLEKFQSIYLQKCVKNLDLTHQTELQNALQAVTKCVTFETSSGSDMKDFCSNYDRQFVTCLRNFAKVGAGCLDANEKYLPDFFLNAQSRVLDKFCKGNGLDHITKISNSKCKLPLAQVLNNDFIGTCLPKLNIFNNLEKKDYSLNRIDVCSDLKTSQKCIIKILQTNCEIAKEHVDFLNSMFEEYQKECSLANTNMSNFVVLASLVIISKLLW